MIVVSKEFMERVAEETRQGWDSLEIARNLNVDVEDVMKAQDELKAQMRDALPTFSRNRRTGKPRSIFATLGRALAECSKRGAGWVAIPNYNGSYRIRYDGVESNDMTKGNR